MEWITTGALYYRRADARAAGRAYVALFPGARYTVTRCDDFWYLSLGTVPVTGGN